MRLPDKLLLLAPAEPMDLGGHEYGLCLVNVLCPSRTGVLPFDVVEKTEGVRPLEEADIQCWITCCPRHVNWWKGNKEHIYTWDGATSMGSSWSMIWLSALSKKVLSLLKVQVLSISRALLSSKVLSFMVMYIASLGGLCSNVFLIFHHSLVILNISILFIRHHINICFGLHDIHKVFCMIYLRLGGYELAIKWWSALPDVIKCLVIWEYTSDVLWVGNSVTKLI